MNEAYALTEIDLVDDCGKAVLAADVAGPTSLSVLGIWAQKPRYVDDVLQSLGAFEDVLRSGRAAETSLSSRAAPAVSLGSS